VTPNELRQARRELRLSIRQLAEMLSVDADLVRRMEIQVGGDGHRPIRGSIERLVRAYLWGYRPPDWPVSN
jgi:predicted transcriptional regulator